MLRKRNCFIKNEQCRLNYRSKKDNKPFGNKVPMMIKVNIEFIMVLKKNIKSM